MTIQRGQRGGGDHKRSVGAPDRVLIEQVVSGTGKGRRQLRRLATESHDRIDCGRIGSLTAATDDFMAEKVSRVAGVAVRHVFAPPAIVGQQPVPHPFPADRQERADQRDAVAEFPGGRHAAETNRPCSTQDAMENRLGLIVGGVGHGHVAAAGLVSHILKKTIP